MREHGQRLGLDPDKRPCFHQSCVTFVLEQSSGLHGGSHGSGFSRLSCVSLRALCAFLWKQDTKDLTLKNEILSRTLVCISVKCRTKKSDSKPKRSVLVAAIFRQKIQEVYFSCGTRTYLLFLLCGLSRRGFPWVRQRYCQGRLDQLVPGGLTDRSDLLGPQHLKRHTSPL